jgi:flagellar basal-body rod modification protein FlgD
MSITGLEPVINYSSGSSSTGVSALGKDAFLSLLVTQLRHQDPLSPMESTQFTAQLAQFSSLEQLSGINENLGILQLYQASINNSQAVGFIGKTVKSLGNSVNLPEDAPAEMHFELEGEADEVFVHVYDSTGSFVKTIECGSLDAGEQSIEWDGTDDEGNELSAGSYTFEVIAQDAEGSDIAVTTFMVNKVSGVTFKDGITYLLAGDLKIPVSNVVEVREG